MTYEEEVDCLLLFERRKKEAAGSNVEGEAVRLRNSSCSKTSSDLYKEMTINGFYLLKVIEHTKVLLESRTSK